MDQSAHPFLSIFHPLPFIDLSIIPYLYSLTILLTITPFSYIDVPILQYRRILEIFFIFAVIHLVSITDREIKWLYFLELSNLFFEKLIQQTVDSVIVYLDFEFLESPAHNEAFYDCLYFDDLLHQQILISAFDF